MRKLLLAGAALAALSAGATAADLGAQPVPAAVIVPGFSWNGFYLGGQVGGVWVRDRDTEFVTLTGSPTGYNERFTANGFTGGLHAGFNYQLSSLVVGLEADIELSGASGFYVLAINGNGTRLRSSWQGSLRGRAGFAVDRALFYVTGGLAVAQFRHSYFTPDEIEGFTRARAGWTVGAGVEYAFAPNWTARAEYRYSDYGTFSNDSLVAFPGYTYQHNPRSHSARVGVSYLFSTGFSAVAARY